MRFAIGEAIYIYIEGAKRRRRIYRCGQGRTEFWDAYGDGENIFFRETLLDLYHDFF